MPGETRYAKSGDIHIAYQVTGDGPIDLVYVPTWISHVEHLWEEPRVAGFLERLSSFARLIMFDRRGSGLSDRTPAPALEEQMDDVLAVLDAVGSERAALFAQLEGGGMATLFAATHPERTGALVLFSAWARIVYDDDYQWANMAEARDQLVDEITAGWGSKDRLPKLAPSVADEPRFQEWLAKLQRLAASPGAARTAFGVVGRYDVRPVLPLIRVPTLVMNRRDDPQIDPRHSRYLAEHIPGARYLELPGRDSLAVFEDGDTVLDEIGSSSPGSATGASPSGSCPRSCSQTSWDRPSVPPSSAIGAGGSCCVNTTRSFAGSSSASAGASSSRPATGCSRRSTARRAASAARAGWSSASATWASSCGRGSTPARAR